MNDTATTNETTDTPRMQKHAGLAYALRHTGPMFAEGVALERELIAANAEVDRLRIGVLNMGTNHAKVVNVIAEERDAALKRQQDEITALRSCFAEASHNAGPAFVMHEEHKAALARVKVLEAGFMKAFGVDSPNPIWDILESLCSAVDYAFAQYDMRPDGWESWSSDALRGTKLAEILRETWRLVLTARPVAEPCDHDWKLQDDSFDHEFGTEQQHSFVCETCGESRLTQPHDYEEPDHPGELRADYERDRAKDEAAEEGRRP